MSLSRAEFLEDLIEAGEASLALGETPEGEPIDRNTVNANLEFLRKQLKEAVHEPDHAPRPVDPEPEPEAPPVPLRLFPPVTDDRGQRETA